MINIKTKHKYKRWILICVILFCISSVGITYARWTNYNQITQNITTSILDFVFHADDSSDFQVKLIHNGAAGTSSADTILDATIDISNNKALNISGVSDFAMAELLSGAASLEIDYRMVPSDLQNGMLKVANRTYDLGTIPFQLDSSNVFWKISNSKGQSWGVGVDAIGTPSIINSLLPYSLDGLHGYNTISSTDNGVVKGTITISQTQITAMQNTSGPSEVLLSSFGFSEKINQAIVEDESEFSSLEIMANYSFHIPLIFDQENVQ